MNTKPQLRAVRDVDTYDLVSHLRMERQRQAEWEERQARRMATIVAGILMAAALAAWWAAT